jgi:hypothetical protein
MRSFGTEPSTEIDRNGPKGPILARTMRGRSAFINNSLQQQTAPDRTAPPVFQDRCLQPLGHPSFRRGSIMTRRSPQSPPWWWQTPGDAARVDILCAPHSLAVSGCRRSILALTSIQISAASLWPCSRKTQARKRARRAASGPCRAIMNAAQRWRSASVRTPTMGPKRFRGRHRRGLRTEALSNSVRQKNPADPKRGIWRARS